MADMAELKRLFDFIGEAKRIFAFTGAGVSTLSGIRDFRGKNGVYLQPWRGMPVEEILSLDCFLERPELFYGWAKEFLYRLHDFHPSCVHTGLAALEKAGKLEAVYTQNIDMLHQEAGSRKVFELHGSPAGHHCLKCGMAFGYEEIAAEVLAAKVPRCRFCNGLVKPDIVFYGENLNEELLRQAFQDMKNCDLLLMLGSSLTVYPAASLPETAARHGAKLVIVNEQPTGLDNMAVLKFNDLKQVFQAVQDLAETMQRLTS